MRTPFSLFQRDEAVLQIRNIIFNDLCASGSLVHVRTKLVDVFGIFLQREADFVFEVIDDNKVREEGEYVLYLQKRRVLDEFHSPKTKYS